MGNFVNCQISGSPPKELHVSHFCGLLLSHFPSNINLLLTERERSTGEYWPKVVAVQTERSKVRTKPTKCQYSPGRLELARLESSLLYGTRAMLVLNFPAFKSKKYTAVDCFHGDSKYGKILTNKGPIRTLRCTLPFNNSRVIFHWLKEMK